MRGFDFDLTLRASTTAPDYHCLGLRCALVERYWREPYIGYRTGSEFSGRASYCIVARTHR
jgi:hypothetical protein